MVFQIWVDICRKIPGHPVSCLANGDGRINVLEHALTRLGIAAVRYDVEHLRAADVAEERANRGDLLRQGGFARVRKNFERKRADRLDSRMRPKQGPIHSADSPAFRASQVVAVVWHCFSPRPDASAGTRDN